MRTSSLRLPVLIPAPPPVLPRLLPVLSLKTPSHHRGHLTLSRQRDQLTPRRLPHLSPSRLTLSDPDRMVVAPSDPKENDIAPPDQAPAEKEEDDVMPKDLVWGRAGQDCSA